MTRARQAHRAIEDRTGGPQMAMHAAHAVGRTTPAPASTPSAATGPHCPPSHAQAPPAAGRRAPRSCADAGPHASCPPTVRGGGANAALRVGPDPALVALAGMLGNATPPAAPPSAVRVLADRLLSLLQDLGGRIGSLTRSDPDLRPVTIDAPALLETAAPRPMQPVPPTGPLMTLDRVDGTIVLASDAELPGSDPDSSGGHGASGDQSPSSWVPVTGALRLLRLRLRDANLVDRIDALLSELGLTRLQLVLATLVAPPIVVLLVATIAELVGGS